METVTPVADWIEHAATLRYAADWRESAPVEIRQTHISLLLLGKDRVLKLKKPVNFGFLDYTTLEKRRLACEAEVRLNRRLCPSIYLGVQPIFERNGVWLLSPGGRIADYGVLMKRLPAERMLDEMVRSDQVTEEIIDRVAVRLSEFHRTALRGPAIDVFGEWAWLRQNWEENFAQTRVFIGRTIGGPAYRMLHDWVAQRLELDRALFERRVRGGKIVDGHGDVRCESVCVNNGICLFDCIEFNDRFRCNDVANEAAFLAMDLDSLGRPDLGYYFTERYEARSPDPEFFRLLPFYRCYRAYVRGKVLSFRLDEPEFTAEEKRTAAERASGFFELARRYAASLAEPTAILVHGFSGTGKTTLARAIAGELGLRALSTDAVRATLFGAAKTESGFEEGAYSPEATRQTYHALFEQAKTQLARDGGVVLDGTFRTAEQRSQALALARSFGASLREIECQLPPELVLQRLNRRRERGDGLSDATWEIYRRQRATQKASAPSPLCLPIDTRLPLAACARAATDWLRTGK